MRPFIALLIYLTITLSTCTNIIYNTLNSVQYIFTYLFILLVFLYLHIFSFLIRGTFYFMKQTLFHFILLRIYQRDFIILSYMYFFLNTFKYQCVK